MLYAFGIVSNTDPAGHRRKFAGAKLFQQPNHPETGATEVGKFPCKQFCIVHIDLDCQSILLLHNVTGHCILKQI